MVAASFQQFQKYYIKQGKFPSWGNLPICVETREDPSQTWVCLACKTCSMVTFIRHSRHEQWATAIFRDDAYTTLHLHFPFTLRLKSSMVTIMVTPNHLDTSPVLFDLVWTSLVDLVYLWSPPILSGHQWSSPHKHGKTLG